MLFVPDPFTPCQKHQKKALNRTSSELLIGYVPRCKPDGSYEEVQCHGSTGQCWCVGVNGNEVWGTAVRGLPDCSLEGEVTNWVVEWGGVGAMFSRPS